VPRIKKNVKNVFYIYDTDRHQLSVLGASLTLVSLQKINSWRSPYKRSSSDARNHPGTSTCKAGNHAGSERLRRTSDVVRNASHATANRPRRREVVSYGCAPRSSSSRRLTTKPTSNVTTDGIKKSPKFHTTPFSPRPSSSFHRLSTGSSPFSSIHTTWSDPSAWLAWYNLSTSHTHTHTHSVRVRYYTIKHDAYWLEMGQRHAFEVRYRVLQ